MLVPFGPVGLTAFVLSLCRQGSRIVAVGVPLVEIVGESALDHEVLERSHIHGERVVGGVALEIIGVVLYKGYRVVDLLAAVVERVEGIGRLEERVEVHC